MCILEAEKLGLQNDPEVAVKIRDRSLQILVNESYEYFVATPLISPADLDAARENAKKELFASHVLVGHAGAYLGKPPQRTVDEALLLSQQKELFYLYVFILKITKIFIHSFLVFWVNLTLW